MNGFVKSIKVKYTNESVVTKELMYMKKWSQRKAFIVFIVSWFLINVLQVIFTEITNDEAYYQLYGKHLAWGYFDHPPMVAIVTHLSSLLFSGNLGIRFITVLLQIATLLITWKLLDVRKLSKDLTVNFFIVAASLIMFSAYGFITTPDVPLLFFTAVFLYAYKSFLKDSSWSATFLLTISMAGLVYSKYQAVLVIGFVLLSNIRLLTNYKFWLAGITALFLLAPHMLWQYNNDFPSFKYHLVDRSAGFKWRYILEYLPNQLAVFNPFTFAAVIYVLLKYKVENLFERALYFLIIGFVSFFWLSALRGHVEPQWTVACSLPILILLANRSNDNEKLQKYIRRFVGTSIVLVLVIRILLTTTLLPSRLGFSGKEAKYKAIGMVSDQKPVVFNSSFQEPSLFTYFNQKPSLVISSLESRQTQFDLWQFEQNYQNKAVFVCMHLDGKSKVYTYRGGEFEGFFADSLQTTNRIKIKFDLEENNYKPGDTISLSFAITNPTKHPINFNHSEFPVEVCAVFINGKDVNVQATALNKSIVILKPNETLTRFISVTIPDLRHETYHFGLSLKTLFGPTPNSNFVKIHIIQK